MSSQRARRLAWIPPVLAAALVAAHGFAYHTDPAVWVFSFGFVTYAAVGGLIVSRYPRNPVGWLFCVIGIGFAGGDLLSSYGSHASQPPALAVLVTATGPGTLVLLALALMLFPTGHYLSRGWRRAGIAVIAVNLAGSIVLALEPGPLSASQHVDNPLGVDAAAGLLHALATASQAVPVVTVAVALASVFVRFRTVRGLERQQLKWLVLSAAVSVFVLIVVLVVSRFVNLDSGSGQVIAGVVFGLINSAPPVAAAIAILRYRLYDIDVVINRALVYGALTATLGATYLALVLLIGLAVGRSGFAVAASTLAVAALFGPARARIQAAVDRRFYRRKYDVERTLEAFAARLRDEVALDALDAELRGVISSTMQPAHVSLWLRSPRQLPRSGV
jgi:hypothetical protein